MDATRKPAPELLVFQPSEALLAAIDASLGRLAARPRRLAVAFSGGRDSTMLAVHAAALAQRDVLELHLLHIHHGLQAIADLWQRQAHELAERLGVVCHSLRVEVTGSDADGTEAAARVARYRGLALLAEQAGVEHILLGHHRDDQAETVLLRLLRGSGPQGLAAMGDSMSRDGLTYLRPLLDVDRSVIDEVAERFERQTGWLCADDPTNAEDRYTRSALRERIVPELDRRWPSWRPILARHARLAAQTNAILEEVAEEDFGRLEPSEDGSGFSLARWRELSEARQAHVLRYWLEMHELRMPTERRLREWMRQLRGLHAMGHDRHMRVKHGQAWIVCIKGRVSLEMPDSGI
ncbi:tRNA lysidine(34) synthetase TilS [Paracandidimonas soli]|uniref:tRNA lysidine(34) synthetase TilS n=1 Tax=Paracandidimonas soli TaxID=1917182 RepID=UPI003342C897